MARHSGDDIVDSDEGSINDENLATRWSYDLKEALEKEEYKHLDTYDTISAKGNIFWY